MMHMPSSSPPLASGRRVKLAWPANDVGIDAPRAAASPPRCRAIESRIIARSSSSFMHRHRIDDADNACVDRRLCRVEGKARFPAPDEEDFLAHAGAGGIGRDERPPCGLSIGRERLHYQQLDPNQGLVLARHDDVADHARELHQSATSIASTIPTIAASTGTSFIPDAMRAELPLTTSTVSPTPASTVSSATR